MPRNFDELSRQVDEELAGHPDGDTIREQVQRELEAELDAHAVSLQELRRARAMTQTQLANVLDVSQAQISRIETQADLLLSTLVSYVEAMGGELEVVARFPDQPPAYLTIGELLGHERADCPGISEIDLVPALRAALNLTMRHRASFGDAWVARGAGVGGVDPVSPARRRAIAEDLRQRVEGEGATIE